MLSGNNIQQDVSYTTIAIHMMCMLGIALTIHTGQPFSKVATESG